MFGTFGGAWSPEHDGYDRAPAWENVHDDGSRLDLLSHGNDLMRLDECGPPGDPVPFGP